MGLLNGLDSARQPEHAGLKSVLELMRDYSGKTPLGRARCGGGDRGINMPFEFTKFSQEESHLRDRVGEEQPKCQLYRP